jgi:hypothetical protein
MLSNELLPAPAVVNIVYADLRKDIKILGYDVANQSLSWRNKLLANQAGRCV